MELKQKLELSKTPIHFIKEGSFLKLYNESFYVVDSHFNFHFKPTIKLFKSINQMAVFGGFPVQSIAKYFPHAVPTPYGYYLSNEYNLSGYWSWFQMHRQALSADNRINIGGLTDQQLLFLASWQKDKFPRTIDSAFIQELKDCFNDKL